MTFVYGFTNGNKLEKKKTKKNKTNKQTHIHFKGCKANWL